MKRVSQKLLQPPNCRRFTHQSCCNFFFSTTAPNFVHLVPLLHRPIPALILLFFFQNKLMHTTDQIVSKLPLPPALKFPVCCNFLLPISLKDYYSLLLLSCWAILVATKCFKVAAIVFNYLLLRPSTNCSTVSSK